MTYKVTLGDTPVIIYGFYYPILMMLIRGSVYVVLSSLLSVHLSANEPISVDRTISKIIWSWEHNKSTSHLFIPPLQNEDLGKPHEMEEAFFLLDERYQSLDHLGAKCVKSELQSDLQALRLIRSEQPELLNAYTWRYRVACRYAEYYRERLLLISSNEPDGQVQDLLDLVIHYLQGLYTSGYINQFRKNEHTQTYGLIESMLIIADKFAPSEKKNRLIIRLFELSRLGEYQNNLTALNGEGVTRNLLALLLHQIEPLEISIENAGVGDLRLASLIIQRNDLRGKYVRLLSTLELENLKRPGVRAPRICFFEGEEYLFQLVSSERGQDLKLHPIESIKPLVERVTAMLSEGLSPLLGNKSTSDLLHTSLKVLHRQFMVEVPLSDHKEWRVDMDGFMSGLPLEALINTQGQFLVNEVNIKYVTGNVEIQKPVQLSRTVAFLQGEFNSTELKLSNVSREKTYLAEHFNMNELQSTDALAGKGSEGMFYTATHQVFDGGQEPKLLLSETDSLSRNGLFLMSQAPVSMVFNACASMAGFSVSGEGNRSFGHRALEVGAKQIIASIWQVEDVSSAMLGVGYLQGLQQGKTSSQSLKSAKESYLESSDKFYQHPFFWAPLVHLGEDVLLEQPTNRHYLLLILLSPLLLLVRWKVKVWVN